MLQQHKEAQPIPGRIGACFAQILHLSGQTPKFWANVGCESTAA
jgi:hypothetical protein